MGLHMKNRFLIGMFSLVIGFILFGSVVAFGAKGSSSEMLPSSVSQAEEAVLAVGTFSGGGNDGSSSSFRLASTVSQVAVGSGSYGDDQAYHGFWYVINGLASIPCCGLYTGGYTGNTNCDVEGRRDMIDITTLIDHVYISHRELCCRANGDIDPKNGELINLSDITRLIDHIYINKAETPFCQ